VSPVWISFIGGVIGGGCGDVGVWLFKKYKKKRVLRKEQL